MINKRNWRLTKEYLDYRLHIDQISEGSWKVEKVYLRYLLEWADEMAFVKCPGKRPTFPEYILSTRLDGKEERLSAVHIKKILSTARRFFLWLIDYDRESKHIKLAWINSIKTKRLSNIPHTKEYVSFEEILNIARAPAENIIERRIRAAAVFWYLSGIRIGAFVTLPILAVDLEKRKVMQFPSLGVHTKNSKHAITFLLDIPELLDVVKEWEREIKAILPDNGFWFAPLRPDTGEIDQGNTKAVDTRVSLARKTLSVWLAKVGLPYRSPHKFRHGHIHYGLSNARNLEDYKAISQNAMHSNMEITDQFYSVLKDEQVKSRISNLGNQGGGISQEDHLYQLFQEFMAWKKSK